MTTKKQMIQDTFEYLHSVIADSTADHSDRMRAASMLIGSINAMAPHLSPDLGSAPGGTPLIPTPSIKVGDYSKEHIM